jgi:hypothetical protein
MNHRSSVAALVISLIACAFASGCASPRQDEPVASDVSPLGSSGGCGPVDFTGEAYAESQKAAYTDALASARKICHETPMFCAVDCDGAPVTDEKCVATAVQGQDGEIGVTWSCSVTISASGSPPEPKTCDVAVRCAPGWQAADTDGDGCPDTCVPKDCGEP